MLSAFLAMIAVLGLLWHGVRDGLLVNLAVGSASHGMGDGFVAMLKDVVRY